MSGGKKKIVLMKDDDSSSSASSSSLSGDEDDGEDQAMLVAGADNEAVDEGPDPHLVPPEADDTAPGGQGSSVIHLSMQLLDELTQSVRPRLSTVNPFADLSARPEATSIPLHIVWLKQMASGGGSDGSGRAPSVAGVKFPLSGPSPDDRVRYARRQGGFMHEHEDLSAVPGRRRKHAQAAHETPVESAMESMSLADDGQSKPAAALRGRVKYAAAEPTSGIPEEDLAKALETANARRDREVQAKRERREVLQRQRAAQAQKREKTLDARKARRDHQQQQEDMARAAYAKKLAAGASVGQLDEPPPAPLFPADDVGAETMRPLNAAPTVAATTTAAAAAAGSSQPASFAKRGRGRGGGSRGRGGGGRGARGAGGSDGRGGSRGRGAKSSRGTHIRKQQALKKRSNL